MPIGRVSYNVGVGIRGMDTEALKQYMLAHVQAKTA